MDTIIYPYTNISLFLLVKGALVEVKTLFIPQMTYC